MDQNTQRDLEVLDALLAAIDRRSEVMAAIADSDDTEAAVAVIAQLLDVDEIPATAVANLQWRRFTRGERARIARQRQELLRTTGDGD
ncbi:MAG: DNA gyrase subunit A [Micrococcales bacterium]|nr:DNA gyrase subunit A [Micrococcales bacterium]